MFYVQTRSDFKAQVKTDLLSTELSRENSVVLEENCFLFFLFSLSLSLSLPLPAQVVLGLKTEPIQLRRSRYVAEVWRQKVSAQR